MKPDSIEIMRHKLRNFISYDEGGKIRESLKDYAKEHYHPMHTSNEYLLFMNDNACTFKKVHNQSTTFPYYWGLFSQKSQYVHGDSIEECLDKALKKCTQTHPNTIRIQTTYVFSLREWIFLNVKQLNG